MFGSRDHADAALHTYKVFVNPSETEVLATTTAEALAMGKFVVIPKLPCNQWFYPFPNVLTYETPGQFREVLRSALSSTPVPLSEDESRSLSWTGATERFVDIVFNTSRLAKTPQLQDELAHCTH